MAAKAAIVRPYVTRAMCCMQSDGRWRNPADRYLEAWALAWGVDNGQLFDIFELPPNELRGEGADSPILDELARFGRVVTTIALSGLPVPVPSDIPGWSWIHLSDTTTDGKIEVDGDALAAPLSDGSGWFLIEQTAPARHLSAFEKPGRAMVFAIRPNYRPSAYAELEFAAYDEDAEQTLTFRLTPSLK